MIVTVTETVTVLF